MLAARASAEWASIALANGIYIALALTGFSLLQQSPLLLMGMQWLASLYLAWLGWMFMHASLAPAVLPGTQDRRGPRAGAGAGMVAGFLSALLNPKNGVFYFGLFTLMVDAHTGPERKLFYGTWMFFAVLAWDAALVCSISQRHVVATLRRALPFIERAAGLLLMIAAATLAMVRAA